MENLTIEQKMMAALGVFLVLAVGQKVANGKFKEAFGVFYCGICAGYLVNVVFVEEFLVVDVGECVFRAAFGTLWMVKGVRNVCGGEGFLYSKFQHQMILKREVGICGRKVQLASCGDVNKVAWMVGCCFCGFGVVLVLRVGVGVYFFFAEGLSGIDSVLFVTLRVVDIFTTLLYLIITTPLSPPHSPINSLLFPSLLPVFTTLLLYSSTSYPLRNRIFLSSSFNFLYTLILSNY